MDDRRPRAPDRIVGNGHVRSHRRRLPGQARDDCGQHGRAVERHHDHHGVRVHPVGGEAQLGSARRGVTGVARAGALQQQIAFPRVSRERRGALELAGGLLQPPEFGQKIAAYAG